MVLLKIKNEIKIKIGEKKMKQPNPHITKMVNDILAEGLKSGILVKTTNNKGIEGYTKSPKVTQEEFDNFFGINNNENKEYKPNDK